MEDSEKYYTPYATSLIRFLSESGWTVEEGEDTSTCMGGVTTESLELGYVVTLSIESDQALVSVVFEVPVAENLHVDLLKLLNEINKGSIPGSASYHFEDSMVEVCSSMMVAGIDDLDDPDVEEIAVETFAQIHEILIGVSLAIHMAITELQKHGDYTEAFATFSSAIDTFIAALDLELDPGNG